MSRASGRGTSTDHAAQGWDQSSAPARSLRHAPLGRATPDPLGLPHTPDAAAKLSRLRRRVTVGPQDVRFVQKPLAQPMTPMNGHYNREIEANGPTGIMVLRMRMPYGADAGPCRLQPRTRGGEFGTLGPTGKSCCSHLGGPGEPPGATRGPRGRPGRPSACPDGRRTAPTESPAGEKG